MYIAAKKEGAKALFALLPPASCLVSLSGGLGTKAGRVLERGQAGKEGNLPQKAPRKWLK